MQSFFYDEFKSKNLCTNSNDEFEYDVNIEISFEKKLIIFCDY